jgi:hypothetical protein
MTSGGARSIAGDWRSPVFRRRAKCEWTRLRILSDAAIRAKEWRARKKRQAEITARVWEQLQRFEYIRRCAEVSAEARGRR